MQEPLARFSGFPVVACAHGPSFDALRLGLLRGLGSGTPPQDVLSSHATPERQSLFESHRQRRWLTRWSYRGCWWLRKAAVSSDTARRWAGTVAADERSQTAGPTGHAPPGGPQAWGRRPRGRRQQRAPGRGHEDTDRPASSAWVRRQGPVGLQAVQDCTVKTIQKAADRAGHAGRRLCTDSASRYRARKG